MHSRSLVINWSQNGDCIVRTKRGIALALTLLVLSVMTLVSIAFFQAYHSHFSITRASRDSETAFMACEAAYDYVAYRLEHDRDWGATAFTTDDLGKDTDTIYLEILSKVGTHEFEGKVLGSGATIKGTIYNNLGGLLAEDAVVPPSGTARCQLECQSGDATRRVEFLVRVAPLFDSSALTRANLNVDAETLTLRSLDTNRNMLRAEQDIFVPDMLTNDSTQFLLPGTDSPDNNGLMWSKGDIYSYDAAGDPQKLEDADDFAQASESSHGKMVAGADSHFSVFDLDKELIKVPEGHTSIPLNNPFTGAPMPGRFTFTRRSANVAFNTPYYIADGADSRTRDIPRVANGIYIDVLEYYANPEDTVPTAVFRAKERTDDLLGAVDVPAEITEERGFMGWDEDTGVLQTDDIATTDVDIDIPGYTGDVEILDNNKLVFGNETAANFTFDLENQEVTATHDAVVEVAGEFHVTSEDNGSPVPPPRLNLGYETSGSIDGGVSKSVIRADGTIDIKNGITEGLGALISNDGDVRIQPKNTNTVTVDSSLAGSGLLIFAGGDVELTNPDETENWIFKGLVYARGGIRMNGQGTGNATFEGSIVSLQETTPEAGGPNGIEFLECQDIEFIYSSKMLEAYVHQLPGERIQVETIYWRD